MDPCLRLMDPDPVKTNFKRKFFCFLLFEDTFTSFLKIKVQKSYKTVGVKVFLLFLLDDRRIRIRISTSDQWIRIWEAQKHVNPVDPEHWYPLFDASRYVLFDFF